MKEQLVANIPQALGNVMDPLIWLTWGGELFLELLSTLVFPSITSKWRAGTQTATTMAWKFPKN